MTIINEVAALKSERSYFELTPVHDKYKPFFGEAQVVKRSERRSGEIKGGQDGTTLIYSFYLELYSGGTKVAVYTEHNIYSYCGYNPNACEPTESFKITCESTEDFKIYNIQSATALRHIKEFARQFVPEFKNAYEITKDTLKKYYAQD